MMKVQENNLIQIGNEPIVILPLKKWNKIEEKLQDLEEATRFNIAYTETRGEKAMSLQDLKKKYKLQ